MAYKLAYSDYPGTDTGPPDPERWVGPPGPIGPQGIPGPRSADVANVLDFGADPTGIADSTAAIRAAIATGRTVFVPAGDYRITGRLYLGSQTRSQALIGDGVGATLLVGQDFDPTVTDGVVVFGWGTSSGITNDSAQRPMIANINIKFAQPADIVTPATATSAAGATTITVASTAGIVIGMGAYDVTSPNSIPAIFGGTVSVPTTVVSIAGNVITLSTAIAAPGVAISDSIHFASVRSMWLTLAGGGTATQGGTGVQYPWAIYCTNVQTLLIDNVMTVGAWNGIYVRGSSWQIGKANINAFNIGLDVDASGNFTAIEDYRFWNWGYASSDQYGKDRTALVSNVYYDGVTVAANLGRCDGLAVTNFQTWVGKVNITSTWTWGSFLNLMLDGTNSSLNISSASSSGWVQIGNCYSTKGPRTFGDSISVSPASASFLVVIDNIVLASGSAFYRGITQTNGRMVINGGYIWHGLQAVRTMINCQAGSVQLSNLYLDAATGRTDGYIHALGGVSFFQMNGCVFAQAPGVGAMGVTVDAGSVQVSLDLDIIWNGWQTTLPTTLPLLNISPAVGPSIIATAGVAHGTAPSGSLWLRTDGAAGSRLYVSQGGGTWNAVAGV